MVVQAYRRRAVDSVVHSEELLLLESSSEKSAARSPG